MEINHFIQNFAAQFDDIEAEKFNPEVKFRDLDEWSSLRALSVIAMTNEEYDVFLTGEDIRNSQTIQDLFQIINSKCQKTK
jgi:acyl carrier protein